MRTAAAGAVAAKHLARTDARRAILGAGVQARLQLEALTLVRPIREARIWARDAAKARPTLPRPCGETLGIPVRADADAGASRCAAPISIVTTTPATAPILKADWLSRRPARHGHGLGCRAQERDRARGHRAQADLYVATASRQTRRLGELHHALAAGVVAADAAFAELGQIIAGATPGRRSRERHHHLPTSPAPACRTPRSPRCAVARATAAKAGTLFESLRHADARQFR